MNTNVRSTLILVVSILELITIGQAIAFSGSGLNPGSKENNEASSTMEIQISGKVVLQKNGEPLPGVNVMIKGTL